MHLSILSIMKKLNLLGFPVLIKVENDSKISLRIRSESMTSFLRSNFPHLIVTKLILKKNVFNQNKFLKQEYYNRLI